LAGQLVILLLVLFQSFLLYGTENRVPDGIFEFHPETTTKHPVENATYI
jgi:hypothetical protein